MGNAPERRKTVLPASQSHKSFSEMELRRLLEHEPWIRRLAKSLVADENRVNELIQHVLTEALKNPPRNPRPWITVVMRAAAWRMRRSESRRKFRENAVAREEMQLPGVPGADQEETRRRLVSLVQELEPAYREVLLAHFFEDLSLEEFAKRQGVPSATMRTRLRRALAQMREKLRAHYGDPSRWVFALAPISGIRNLSDIATASPSSSKVASVVSQGSKKMLALAAALIVATSAVLLAIPKAGPEPYESKQSSERSAVSKHDVSSSIRLASSAQSAGSANGAEQISVDQPKGSPAISTTSTSTPSVMEEQAMAQPADSSDVFAIDRDLGGRDLAGEDKNSHRYIGTASSTPTGVSLGLKPPSNPSKQGKKGKKNKK